jgi:deazaflavin-dependent oxidoreductase (nitroreductase family)
MKMQPAAEKIAPGSVDVQGRVFPTADTSLYKIMHDPAHRKTFHANLKRYNPWMVFFYRIGLLPLFGMSKSVMLLTTRGNKSGKLRTTPIGYYRIGGAVHLFSAWGQGTAWYQNMIANPDEVWIQVGLRKWPVNVRYIDQPREMRQTLERFIAELPAQAKYLFGFDTKQDSLETADFSQVYERVMFLRFEVK